MNLCFPAEMQNSISETNYNISNAKIWTRPCLDSDHMGEEMWVLKFLPTARLLLVAYNLSQIFPYGKLQFYGCKGQ